MVRRRCTHISKNIQPTLSREPEMMSGLAAAHSNSTRRPRRTRGKKSASFCVFCGQRISPSHQKAGSRRTTKAQRPGPPDAEQTYDSWPNRNAIAGFAEAHGSATMCSYLQKSPANSLSRAGNDVRTRRSTFELYPQTTQITRKNLRLSACSAGKKSLHHIKRRAVAERSSSPTATN